MENKDSFKLSKDADNIVELLYDQPKQGQNAYGSWYLYGVNKEGQETSFFATENLHKKLSTFGRGATVNIRLRVSLHGMLYLKEILSLRL